MLAVFVLLPVLPWPAYPRAHLPPPLTCSCLPILLASLLPYPPLVPTYSWPPALSLSLFTSLPSSRIPLPTLSCILTLHFSFPTNNPCISSSAFLPFLPIYPSAYVPIPCVLRSNLTLLPSHLLAFLLPFVFSYLPSLSACVSSLLPLYRPGLLSCIHCL